MSNEIEKNKCKCGKDLEDGETKCGSCKMKTAGKATASGVIVTSVLFALRKPIINGVKTAITTIMHLK